MLIKIKGLRDGYQDKSEEEKFNKESFEKTGVKEAINRAEFIEKTNSICDVLIKNAKLSKKDRVLDVGCYTGLYEYLLERRGYKNFVGIDVSKDAIRIAKEIKKKLKLKSTFAVGDAENLKFPDNSFDVVLFFATLHHLPKKSMEKSLAEAKRVLRGGGQIVVAEPNLWNLKIMMDHLLRKMDYNEFPYSYSDMVREIKKRFKVEKAFTRLFVPRTEKADPIIGKIPILNKLGSQAFIIGIKK